MVVLVVVFEFGFKSSHEKMCRKCSFSMRRWCERSCCSGQRSNHRWQHQRRCQTELRAGKSSSQGCSRIRKSRQSRR
ncbi:hypothetical protein KCU76_g131, partial [Aureobasidium melanogenum]